MTNQQTRRLSKMPDEVRAEISPWFTEKRAIQVNVPEKINILDTSANYISSNLKQKRSDLDMNHHVSNVKYVNWMLEAIPCELVKNHQLSGITLEYRKECGRPTWFSCFVIMKIRAAQKEMQAEMSPTKAHLQQLLRSVRSSLIFCKLLGRAVMKKLSAEEPYGEGRPDATRKI